MENLFLINSATKFADFNYVSFISTDIDINWQRIYNWLQPVVQIFNNHLTNQMTDNQHSNGH